MDKPYNILSLDGGGIRGILSARILDRVVERAPSFLDRFSLFAGTSTGGILALGLAKGMLPSDLVTLYRTRGSDIFRKRFLGGLWGAKYSADGLRSALYGLFGTATLSTLRRDVMVPAFRLSDSQTKFFESHDDIDASVVDVALSTSAAPTYFPSHDGFIDGGVAVNEPSMCAVTQALRWGVDLADVRVLSIGTGLATEGIPGRSNDWGFARWAPKIVPLVLDGASGVADEQCRNVLGDRYLRFNPALPREMEMDDLATVPELLRLADAVDVAPILAWASEGAK